MRVLACVLLLSSSLAACGNPWVEGEVSCEEVNVPGGETEFIRTCERNAPPGMEGGRWVSGCGSASWVCSDGAAFTTPGLPQCADDGSIVTCPDGALPLCVYLPAPGSGGDCAE